MISEPWTTPKEECLRTLSWGCKDARDAWAELLNVHFSGINFFGQATAAVRAGSNNERYLVAGASAFCPEFKELCAMSVEELEALRAVAERKSELWCFLTAAVAWHETPLEHLPHNAPTKLP